LPSQCLAEVGIDLRDIGLDPDRLAKCGNRLVEPCSANATPRLECYSACNFDPLNRGIGVQN
jgi:hypothetical protein